MTEVKLYKKPLKGLKIFVFSIAFIAIGVFATNKETIGTTNYIMSWIWTCFFGLGILVGLFQTFDRRPQIIITENGIWDRTTNQDEIKWEQIKSAYPLNVYQQKFVSLKLDKSFVIKKKLYKWSAKLNKSIGAQNINLHVSQLKIDENKMANFISEIIQIEKENRPGIIKKYFN
jgi:hypothetical protein